MNNVINVFAVAFPFCRVLLEAASQFRDVAAYCIMDPKIIRILLMCSKTGYVCYL